MQKVSILMLSHHLQRMFLGVQFENTLTLYTKEIVMQSYSEFLPNVTPHMADIKKNFLIP